jgi:ABC-type tungstate transport system substrate-binding protein
MRCDHREITTTLSLMKTQGDVQTAAVLGIVLCSELKLGKQKLLRYVQAYMGQSLHVQTGFSL